MLNIIYTISKASRKIKLLLIIKGRKINQKYNGKRFTIKFIMLAPRGGLKNIIS